MLNTAPLKKMDPTVPGTFTEDIRDAPPDERVCYCAGIAKGEILEAAAQGARTLAEIKAATGACTLARCRETSPRGH